jgi:putative restriction endonuclease
MAGNRRWGVLIHDRNPVGERDLAAAEQEVELSAAVGFTLIEVAPSMVETRLIQLARTTAFRRIVVRLYGDTCCACRSALATSQGQSELEAAHIVPRNIGGINDARNGLGLCRRHHWAFDRGLFGVDASRRIHVPDGVRSMPQNEPLNSLHGVQITEALKPSMAAHADALAWHMEHIVSGRSQ